MANVYLHFKTPGITYKPKMVSDSVSDSDSDFEDAEVLTHAANPKKSNAYLSRVVVASLGGAQMSNSIQLLWIFTGLH